MTRIICIGALAAATAIGSASIGGARLGAAPAALQVAQNARVDTEAFRSELNGLKFQVDSLKAQTAHLQTVLGNLTDDNTVFVAFDQQGAQIPNGPTLTTIVELELPAGTYAILAKVNLIRDIVGDYRNANAFCLLITPGSDGGSSDSAGIVVEQLKADVVAVGTSYAEGSTHVVVNLEAGTTISAADTVALRCRSGFPDGDANVVKYNGARIVAIKTSGDLFTQDIHF